MAFAFLPHEGAIWLCQANGPDVTPLVLAPGDADAVRRFSKDGAEFGFLDQRGKRLGHYRLLESAPWFECVTSPTALSKSCRAYDFLIHKGRLIVGGHGRDREALWVLGQGTATPWRTVALPEGIGKRGKSIDALFARGDKLIAIDNVLHPKWILVYQLEPELTSDSVEMVRLATHTTYETTWNAVEGKEYYAIYSNGINHGTASHHVALLDKQSLEHRFVWSGAIPKTTEELSNEARLDFMYRDFDESAAEYEMSIQDEIDSTLKLWKRQDERFRGDIGAMLAEIKDMIFCGDHLFLALGNLGVQVADVLQCVRPKAPKKGSEIGSNFRPIPLSKIRVALNFQCLAERTVGTYIIGKDEANILTYEWIPESVICSTTICISALK